MNKVIAFLHDGQHIATTHITDDNTLKTLLDRDIVTQPFMSFDIISDDQPPDMCQEDPSHLFFSCWTFDSHDDPTKIIVDMESARPFWLEQLRSMRDEQLEYWDQKMLRALGQQNSEEIARIENIKQQLRDLPELVDLEQADTVDELMDTLPAVLLLR